MKVMTLLIALLILPVVAADLTITSTPPAAATVGILYTYQVAASDGTNNTLNYSISGLSGISINSSGFVSFVPTAAGASNVTVFVSNATKQVNQSYTLTVSDNNAMSFFVPLLGGPKQKRSNPKAASDLRKNVYAENKFVLRNTGTKNLTAINFTSTAPSRFNVTFSGVPSSLDPGQEATITILVRVPENFDGFVPEKSERKQVIGEVLASAKIEGVPINAKQDILMEAENLLVIRDVTVSVRGRVKHADENDRVENLRIRDTLQMEVDVENLYGTNNNEDIDIEEVVVAIDTTTKQFDVDNKMDIGNIRANAIETGAINFYVKDDADAGTYKMALQVTGSDENGVLYGDTLSFNLEVVRNQNEISIEKVAISPEKPACKTKDAVLSVLLHNTGKSNEEKASIKVDSKELGFSEKRQSLKLSRDDTAEQKFTLPLKPGKAVIQIQSFYDDDKLSATDGITIDVPDCAARLQEIVQNAGGTEKEREQKQQKTQQEATGSGSDETVQKSTGKELVPIPQKKSATPFAVLVISVLAAFGAVTMLLWLLLKEP